MRKTNKGFEVGREFIWRVDYRKCNCKACTFKRELCLRFTKLAREHGCRVISSWDYLDNKLPTEPYVYINFEKQNFDICNMSEEDSVRFSEDIATMFDNLGNDCSGACEDGTFVH